MSAHVFRFFVAGEGREGGRAALSAPDRRHAERVLRLVPGDAVEVVDARGAVFAGTLAGEGAVVLEALVAAPQPRMGPTVWLALAGSRADLAVEKLTELGAVAIGALTSERAKGVPRLERWRRVAEAAAKQSKRADLPALLGPAGFDEVVRSAGAVVLEHMAPDAVPVPLAANAVLLIGPEAGWSEAELEDARTAGVPLARLPVDTTLRAETAAIVAAALALSSTVTP